MSMSLMGYSQFTKNEYRCPIYPEGEKKRVCVLCKATQRATPRATPRVHQGIHKEYTIADLAFVFEFVYMCLL